MSWAHCGHVLYAMPYQTCIKLFAPPPDPLVEFSSSLVMENVFQKSLIQIRLFSKEWFSSHNFFIETIKQICVSVSHPGQPRLLFGEDA